MELDFRRDFRSSVYWRTGRKVGRTIYAQVGTDPSDDDVLIGMMDSPGLAQDVVDAHNKKVRIF